MADAVKQATAEKLDLLDFHLPDGRLGIVPDD
jgi:hypothetical protein